MPVAEKPKFEQLPITPTALAAAEEMAANATAVLDSAKAEPEKPSLGVTVLIEDLHAVFVMARISMQPRAAPLRPSWKYAESFRRIRRALEDCGRIAT